MKVAVYSNLTKEEDTKSPLRVALESHPQVTDIQYIYFCDLQVTLTQDETVFTFGNFTLSKENVDLLIIRGGFNDFAIAVQLVKFCKKHGIKVFDNNLHKVKYFINKKADMLNFALANLPIPKTFIYTDVAQLEISNMEYPLIMKGNNSSQGKKIYKIDAVEDIETLVQREEKKLSDYLIQEYIEYEQDIRLLVIGDEVIGSMRRIPQKGEFRANFSLGGDVELFVAPDDMKELAVKAAKSCELEMSGVDILIDKAGKPYVLEANRTPGMTGISKALGFNVAEKLLDYIFASR